MTLEGAAGIKKPNSPSKRQMSRTMSQEKLQREAGHTGWGDDQLFAAALESPAFVRFDAAMDDALDILSARWNHFAAPSANAVRRTFKFPSPAPLKKPR
jgi:hypothetical protein